MALAKVELILLVSTYLAKYIHRTMAGIAKWVSALLSQLFSDIATFTAIEYDANELVKNWTLDGISKKYNQC